MESQGFNFAWPAAASAASPPQASADSGGPFFSLPPFPPWAWKWNTARPHRPFRPPFYSPSRPNPLLQTFAPPIPGTTRISISPRGPELRCCSPSRMQDWPSSSVRKVLPPPPPPPVNAGARGGARAQPSSRGLFFFCPRNKHETKPGLDLPPGNKQQPHPAPPLFSLPPLFLSPEPGPTPGRNRFSFFFSFSGARPARPGGTGVRLVSTRAAGQTASFPPPLLFSLLCDRRFPPFFPFFSFFFFPFFFCTGRFIEFRVWTANSFFSLFSELGSRSHGVVNTDARPVFFPFGETRPLPVRLSHDNPPFFLSSSFQCFDHSWGRGPRHLRVVGPFSLSFLSPFS